MIKKVLIVILIVTAGAIIYLQWPRPAISPDTSEPSVLSPEELKAECLEDIGEMTDEELMEKIATDKGHAMELMLLYLTCKLKLDKDKELYEKAKRFVQENVTRNKEDSLESLDEAYSREPSFIIQLALGDLTKICPDKLPNLCLEEIGQFSDGGFCENVCNLLDQYSRDKNKLEKDIVFNKTWGGDVESVKKQYRARVAVAYHFGGQDLSLKICDNVPADSTEDCVLGVDRIKDRDCGMLLGTLEGLICDIF